MLLVSKKPKFKGGVSQNALEVGVHWVLGEWPRIKNFEAP